MAFTPNAGGLMACYPGFRRVNDEHVTPNAGGLMTVTPNAGGLMACYPKYRRANDCCSYPKCRWANGVDAHARDLSGEVRRLQGQLTNHFDAIQLI